MAFRALRARAMATYGRVMTNLFDNTAFDVNSAAQFAGALTHLREVGLLFSDEATCPTTLAHVAFFEWNDHEPTLQIEDKGVKIKTD